MSEIWVRFRPRADIRRIKKTWHKAGIIDECNYANRGSLILLYLLEYLAGAVEVVAIVAHQVLVLVRNFVHE